MNFKVFEIKDQTILTNSFNEPFIKISGKKINIKRDLTIYTRHDNDDQLLATIGKSIMGESHDKSFFNSK